MPLLDHFRPPLKGARHWESFHSLWAGAIAAGLNLNVLPKDYVAEVQVHLGGPFEIDVATLEEESEEHNGGGTAVQTWAPPKAALVMPATYPDEFEVRVFDTSAGPTLVAAIEGARNRESHFVLKLSDTVVSGL